MPRFFASPENISDGSVVLFGDDAFHIARSLRMAVGDGVTVSDGRGTDYVCTLDYIRDTECRLTVVSTHPSESEPVSEITLFMAIPKGDKLEVITQKAVELGATYIVPFESERCIKRPAPDKAEKLVLRLNRIAYEAAKQCGRGRLPRVLPVSSFSEMCAALSEEELSIFCYEGEGGSHLSELLPKTPPSKIAVIIGSEGGFSEREAAAICTAGAKQASFGRRILRCETAPDYALSVLSYVYEGR